MSSIYNLKTKILRGLAIAGVALTTTLLTGPLTTAHAYNVKLGDLDIQIDTTLSAGISWQLKDVESQYLPKSNGGPAGRSSYIDPAGGEDGIFTGGIGRNGADDIVLSAGCPVEYGTYCTESTARPSFAGSINTDDGRLNFDKGDPFSGFIRITPEIEARSGNITAFARLNVWHDVVAMDEDSNQMTAGEMYDGRGELWRIQEIGQAPDYRPEAHVCWTVGGEFSYDLLAGRYLGLCMKSGRPANFVTGLERLTPDYYTPANVRRLGR